LYFCHATGFAMRLFNPRFWGSFGLLALIAAAPVGRVPLGIFSSWGAFRDAQPRHCYAIAMPENGRSGSWHSFVSVAILGCLEPRS